MLKDKLQRSTKNRAEAREDAKNEIRIWWIQASGFDPEEGAECIECDHFDALNHEKLWWLEPLVKGVRNPVLVEKALGDSDWALEIRAMEPKIRSFGGISGS